MLSLRLAAQLWLRKWTIHVETPRERQISWEQFPIPSTDTDSSTQVLGAAVASGLVWERLQLGEVLPFHEGVQALSTHRAGAWEKAVTPAHRWPVKHRKSRTWRASRYVAAIRGKWVRERKRERNRRRSPRVLRAWKSKERLQSLQGMALSPAALTQSSPDHAGMLV